MLQAQNLAIKIDKNMQSSGESNIQGYSRSSTPLKTVEPKGKEPSNEAYENKLMDLLQLQRFPQEKFIFRKYSPIMSETKVLVFSGNKRWMFETNSDPSSARIL